MSVLIGPVFRPNVDPRVASDFTRALWMRFLLGRQATFGQDPPMYRRSITAVRWPAAAIVHATYLPASPLPNVEGKARIGDNRE